MSRHPVPALSAYPYDLGVSLVPAHLLVSGKLIVDPTLPLVVVHVVVDGLRGEHDRADPEDDPKKTLSLSRRCAAEECGCRAGRKESAARERGAGYVLHGPISFHGVVSRFNELVPNTER
jgi:hypothetical protein